MIWSIALFLTTLRLASAQFGYPGAPAGYGAPQPQPQPQPAARQQLYQFSAQFNHAPGPAAQPQYAAPQPAPAPAGYGAAPAGYGAAPAAYGQQQYGPPPPAPAPAQYQQYQPQPAAPSFSAAYRQPAPAPAAPAGPPLSFTTNHGPQSAAYSAAPQAAPAPAGPAPKPAAAYPPAQVHYVNIGQELRGDYKFGYDTGKGPGGQSFREEIRAPDGTVTGSYGYVDANGQQRIVKYRAGKEGFQVESDNPAPGQGSAPQQAPPAAAQSAPLRAQEPIPVHRSFNPVPAQFSRPNPIPQAIPAQPGQLARHAFGGPGDQAASGSEESQAPPPPPPGFSADGLPPSFSNLLRVAPQQRAASSSAPQFQRPRAARFQIAPQAQAAPQAGAPADQPLTGAEQYDDGQWRPGKEESYGPPVINTALLSYDIGMSRGGN